jgi:hypothetical protein
MKHTIFTAIASLALAAPAAAQAVAGQRVAGQPVQVHAALEKQVVELARMGVEARITTGAPYSADSITESVQVLSDGNRIARRTVTRIYRDSEGRTRREQLTAAGEVQSVNLSDPVAGSTYVLNPADRTAHRAHEFLALSTASGATVAVRGHGSVTAAKTVDTAAGGVATATAGGGGRGGVGVGVAHAGAMVYPADAGVSLPRMVSPSGFSGGPAVVNTEELGNQVVEGVLATGKRTTSTIAAGTIGNEQPIVIVSEQWFSPDLKVLVMTKHSDPRSGETTYRLTNIAQAEPARSLFEVPADYTLKDSVIRRQSPGQPQ